MPPASSPGSVGVSLCGCGMRMSRDQPTAVRVKTRMKPDAADAQRSGWETIILGSAGEVPFANSRS